MGFRSTFTAHFRDEQWPQWFREKYANSINFSHPRWLVSASEFKTDGVWEHLAEDIQKACAWQRRTGPYVIVFLHECGGVTRCEITKDTIAWTEPTGWARTDGVQHSYCYGCSDASSAQKRGQGA